MTRTREHVQHGPSIDVQTSVEQQGSVAAKRGRVATDEDEDGWVGSQQGLHRLLPQAFAGGVGHHNGSWRRAPTLDVGLYNPGLAGGQVDASVSDRVTTPLDRNHRTVTTDRRREQPDTGIGVDQMTLRGTLDHRTHLVNEGIAAGRAVLKERIGAHPKSTAIDLFMDPRPLALLELCLRNNEDVVRYGHVERVALDDHHPVAGSVADSDQHPTRTWIAPVDEQLLGQRVDGVALVGHHHVVRATRPITGPAVVDRGTDRRASLIADQAPHHRVGHLDPSPSELIDRHRGLHRQLGVRSDVQQVAATAPFQLVCTRHRHPIGRRLKHCHHTGSRPTFIGTHDLGGHRLARERSFDEDDSSVLGSGHPGPVTRCRRHAEFHGANGIRHPPETSLIGRTVDR